MKPVIRPFVYSPRRYDRLIAWIEANGHYQTSRGMKTIEVTNAHLVVHDPTDRLIYAPARRMNVAFAIAEFAQVASGHSELDFITHFAGNMKDFADPYIPNTIGGAYGPRLRGQLQAIEDRLKDDPGSRQAVASIYSSADWDSPSHLIPCTISLQFLIRTGFLDLITTMRSNDVWWGTTYDVFLFTMIQEAMARRLGVKLGEFYLNDGSLHFYHERDGEARKELICRSTSLRMRPLDDSVEPFALYDAIWAARDLSSRKFWQQLKDYEGKSFYDLAIPARYWAARKENDLLEMRTCYDNIRDRALREMLKLWPSK